MLYNKIMIDIEILAAIMKDLGYLDDDDKDDDLKSDTKESLDKSTEKSKIDKPSES